ncbi:MAG: hypothetical protein IPL61_32250 [Myxococcales bacterium]|nr:hypothetical protein [Myxococcales bacterium]
MKPTITLVVDRAAIESVTRGPDAAEAEMKWWHIRDLAAALTAAGADAPIFLGGLDEAPESWAYVLLTGWLDQVASTPPSAPVFRAPSRSLRSTTCREAEKFGLAGALHGISVEGYEADATGRAVAADAPFAVRKEVAARLHWSLTPINSSSDFACTDTTNSPLPTALITYLKALLGEP